MQYQLYKIGKFKYINLNVLKAYSKMFPNTVLGLSDHTHGHSTVLGAIGLGASFLKNFKIIIEMAQIISLP